MEVARERRAHYFKKLSAVELRRLAQNIGLPLRNKERLVSDLAAADIDDGLPIFAVPTDTLREWLGCMVDFYVTELWVNLRRFHPLYHEEVWLDAHARSDFDMLDRRLRAILDSRYWDNGLTGQRGSHGAHADSAAGLTAAGP